MKQGKSLLALLLALALCIALFPAAALAEEEEENGTIALVEEDPESAEEPEEGAGTAIAPAEEDGPDRTEAEDADQPQGAGSGRCGDNLTWSMTPPALTISGTGKMWNYNPSQDDYPPWWEYNDAFTVLVLPAGLTYIGKYAFSGAGMHTMTIPKSVTAIGEGAFSKCPILGRVEIPKGVTRIEKSVFESSGVEAVTFRETLTYIGDRAFIHCNELRELEIPESVTYIGEEAFAFCTRITSLTLPKKLTTIQKRAFYECLGLTSVTIPEGVTSIGEQAFCSCFKLEGLTLPDSVTSIGKEAFAFCNCLESVTIPVNVTSIGDLAFNGCKGLHEIRFKGSAPSFGPNAFKKLTATVYYPENDPTWTEAVRRSYGGDITWVGYFGNPFRDVKESKYYYDAVMWAISQDPPITSGTDPHHFSPNQTCTRAQVVTFLWTACGQPEPEGVESPFLDVKEGKYYYKAVLWAVENDITSGMTADTFGTNEPCARAQVVTFLWTACGRPEPGGSTNPFQDVAEDKFYYKAVLWAVENGITSGLTKDSFGPNQTCTRAQVVTFLYNLALSLET